MSIINKIFSVLILLAFVILGIILPYREGNSLWTILSFLWFFMEPMKFCYRRTYRKVISIGYQIWLLISQIIILFFTLIYRVQASFGIVFGLVLFLLMLSLVSKGENYTRDYDTSKLLLFIISISAFSLYFNEINLGMIQVPVGISIAIFSFFLIFLIDSTKNSELKIIYFILIIGSIFVRQPIFVLLFISLLKNLDYFGPNF